MSHLLINKEDGQYILPLEVIADNYASYYSENDPSSVYAHDHRLIMESEPDAIDWLLGSMDWEEVEDSAVRINTNDEREDKNEYFWHMSDNFKVIK